MAVIVKYVVVRNGVEKMTFTSKKEADAYDKELDIAEALFELMQRSELSIDEGVLDELALYLARQREDAIRVLKGGHLKQSTTAPSAKTPTETADSPEPGDKPAKKGRARNAA